MRFFTPSWHSGDLPDDGHDAVVEAYWAHVETLLPRLSEPLRRLATDITLHDGLINRVLVERRLARLTIEFRCGDMQMGYFDLSLQYSGVDMNSLDIAGLKLVTEASETEALYDEVDLDDLYVHRMLFWIGREKCGGPYREIGVRFRELALQRVPRLDREIDRTAAHYEEINGSTA